MTADRRHTVPAGMMFLLFSVAAFVPACAGCGAANYRDRIKTASVQRERLSVFRELSQPVQLPGTDVLVRVPTVFKTAFNEQSSENGKPIDPRRLKSPVRMSDELTYEATGAYGSDHAAFQLSFQATDVSGFRGDWAKAIRAQLSSLKGAEADWQPVEFTAPSGQSIPWQRLRFEGPMPVYFIPREGTADFRELTTRLEIYVRQEGKYLVAVIFRVPLEMESAVKLETLAHQVCGTIAVAAPAENPK